MSLTAIPELASLSAGRGLVRIPMEQDVPFTPRVRALVDTPEFQRLHHVSQLGLTSRVYPGATHTRFEHALGVFHNALRYVAQLATDARFAAIVDVHSAEVLLAAALLHDLGHWPFCHPIEDMDLPTVPKHEAFAAEFLASGRELAQVLRSEWSVEPDEVLDVLVPRTDTPRLRLMRSILSGPIDIDKMDYLDRDSLHCGVPYGRHFDRNRLMHSLLVNEAGDGLAISAKGRTAAELMVFARYVMFSEVYWHHAVRAATCMFARAFFDLHAKLDLTLFFQRSEWETIAALRDGARGTSAEPLIEGIFGPRRRLYKRVVECSLFQNPELYQRLARRPFEWLVRCGRNLAAELSRGMNVAVSETQVLLDSQPPRREVEFRVEIHYPKERVFRPLAQVSPVVEALSRTRFDDSVKRARLFADPDLAPRLAEFPGLTAAIHAAIDATDGESRFAK